MEGMWVFAIMMAVMLALLFLGFHTATAIGVAAILGFYFGLAGNMTQMKLIVWNMANSQALACIVMFVFMVEVLLMCGLSSRLYSGAVPWISWLPGGLRNTSIVPLVSESPEASLDNG